jgi:Family of unknown function (DUF6084)
VPDLDFHVDAAEAHPFSAAPLLLFKLQVNSKSEEEIHSVVLRAQIMIEATRRQYNSIEQERLLDLFGKPERWSVTLKSMLWTHANVVVPPFQTTTRIDLPVPCTFDFNVAATKYFDGIEDGEIPLSILFSGTIFYAAEDGALQISQIPWEKESRFRLPVKIWKEMMEMYYPNTAWLCLRKDMFDRLQRYKMSHAIPTWESVVDSLLPSDEETLPS